MYGQANRGSQSPFSGSRIYSSSCKQRGFLMKQRLAITALFAVAALYDGLLGLIFLTAAGSIYQWFDITPPNHFGYVHFPAALLLVFALMFAAVALAPHRNRNLIPYGILLKVSFCSVAFYHWFATGIPTMWKPLAICDLVFIVPFVWAYRNLGKE